MDLPLRTCVLLEPSQFSYCHAILAAGVDTIAVLTLPEDLVPNETTATLCKSMLEEARLVTKGTATLCIAIPAGGFYYEPYGETPFGAGVAHFHEMANLCAKSGADCVMVHRAKSMLQARAGVLGARAAGLPVLVSMEPIGEGGLLGETDLISAYAVLRLLGIAAFGYASSVTALQLPALAAICPHQDIPIFSITQNLTGGLSAEDTGELFAKRTTQLSALGVSAIGIWGAQEQQLVAAAAAIHQQPAAVPDERDSLTAADLWAANETQVYYLDANVEFSPPVQCRPDMTDDVLEAEKEVCDLLCVEVLTVDEAYAVSLNNGNMDQMPVCLFCHDEAALEAALFYYNGRAVIDSRCPLAPEVVKRLAEEYGALIL